MIFKRRINFHLLRGIIAVVSVLAAGHCWGQQADFELSYSGDNGDTISGFFGTDFIQTVDCTLTTSANQTDLGAQGWSLSLAADPGLSIVAITVAGTAADDEAADGLRRGGFEKSELTEGKDNQGAVSALLLSFAELVTLPLNGTEVIAKIDIQGPFPKAGVTETRTIRYVDGLQGSGQPVDNVIAHDDNDVEPVKTPYEVRISGTSNNAVTYDCNTDGRINIADAQCMLNWLFLGGPAPGCRDAMDFNGDVRLNIADGISGLNYLFLGGPGPVAGRGCQFYPDCELEAPCE